MPRSIWKGAVSFGLVTIPVKVYGATEDQGHQLPSGARRGRRPDPLQAGLRGLRRRGAVRRDRQGLRGRRRPDGDPQPTTTSRTFPQAQGQDGRGGAVRRVDQIDPTYFEKHLLPGGGRPRHQAVRAAARSARREAGKAAVVKVALRSRETLALIRPVDGTCCCMHTMLWPDELRDSAFAAPDRRGQGERRRGRHGPDVHRPAVAVTSTPSQFTDRYREALEQVVEAKLDGVDVRRAKTRRDPAPRPRWSTWWPRCGRRWRPRRSAGEEAAAS